MLHYFNIKAIEKLKNDVQFAPKGFRYGYVENIFKDDIYESLIKTFPSVEKFRLVDKQSGGGHKRFYVGPNYNTNLHWGCACHFDSLPSVWRGVFNESASAEFLERLKWATGVNFNSLCNFGFAYGNEGCRQGAHLDGAVRADDKNESHSTLACLLYFNQKTGGSSGTCIYDADRITVLFQVPNLRNSMSFFEQHPDAWHGFPPVPVGEDRRIISLAYSLESSPVKVKNSFWHRQFCLKRLRNRLW